jgi:multidrug resistance efflux pump
MIRAFLLPVAAAAMLSFAVYHVVHAQQDKPLAQPVVTPAEAPFTDSVAGVGVVEASTDNVTIGSPVPGVVGEVFVQAGQSVKAGAPLFRLDDRQAQAEVKAREASLAVARAQLARLEALPRPEELPASEARIREASASVVDRESLLLQAERNHSQKIIGEEQLNHHRQLLQVARAQLARAQAEHNLLRAGAWEPDKAIARTTVAQGQAVLDQARTELDRLTVRAPVSGTILQVNVRPGEYAGPPFNPAPVVLGSVQPLHVRVDIDAHDIPRFRPGVSARATLRGDSRRELTLSFVRVVPFVVPKRVLTGDITERVDTRVLQVIYALEPGKRPVYVGQQMDVFIPAAATE